MTTNIATTKEQSARLLQCGVDPDTADMVWTHFESDGEQYERLDVMSEDAYEVSSLKPIPAWSLSALLGLLPHIIEVDDDNEHYFSLAQDYPASEDYSAVYLECWSVDHDAIVRKRDKSPIEACVQLIEWLSANNYKLNGIEKGGGK